MLSVIERNLVEHFVKFALPVTERLFMAREEDFVINFGYVAQHPNAYFPGVAWLSLRSLCCYIASGPQAKADWSQSVLVLENFLLREKIG